MLVIIKSGPDTEEAHKAIQTARDEVADIVLIRDAVYLALPEALEGFCGTAFALDADIKSRSIKEVDKGVKEISSEELIDLMADEDKVLGVF